MPPTSLRERRGRGSLRVRLIDEWQRVPAIWDTVRHASDELAGEKGAWILTGSSTPSTSETAHSGAGRIGRIRMHPMTLAETGESVAKVSLAALFEGEFTPSPSTSETAHSGAGRIGRIRMHPMTLAETGESVAKVSLAALFEGEFTPCQCPNGIDSLVRMVVRGGWPEERLREASDAQIVVRDYLEAFEGEFTPCQCPNGIDSLVRMVVRGGWPEERLREASDAQIVVRDYLEALFEQSVPRLGGNEGVARRLALSLARNLGQSAKVNTFACDVYAHESAGEVSDSERKETASHLDILRRIFLIDEVPGWVPASRSPKRMRVKPKRYFADPSLPVALLGLSPEALLQDWQTFGLVFENLVMRDLDVYARALDDLDVYARALDYTVTHPLRYYYDDSGLEADAIIERADGRWAAIEIKVGLGKVDEAAGNLKRLRDKVCANEKAKVIEPSFMAVVTGMGEAAYRRSDGVYVIPIRALGA